MTFWYLPGSIDIIFLVVYEPHRGLEGLQGVGFQGKNCFTKMFSNFSEIDFGFRQHEEMSKKYYYNILVSARVNVQLMGESTHLTYGLWNKSLRKDVEKIIQLVRGSSF